jgi:hypothetical protein
MPPPHRVLVLREPVTRDDLDRARAEHGWRLVNVVPAATGRPLQVTFLTADEHEGLQFVDDVEAGEQYVIVHQGAGRGEEEVRSSLPAWSDTELARLAAAPASSGDHARAFRWLAIGAGPPRSRGELVAALEAGLWASSPDVRAAALLAVGRLGLGELAARVQALAREDADAAVKERARRLVGDPPRGPP